MPEEMFDHIRPYSQVNVALMPGEPYLILETPAEIRAKIAEALDEDEGDRMGLELGSGEEGALRKMVTLTALEVWAMPDGIIEVEPYEMTTFAMISVLRGISERWWEDYVRRHRRQEPPAGTPGFGVIMAGLAEGFTTQAPARPLKTEDFEGCREAECCCGHTASEHVVSSGADFVGQCGDPACPCPRFHTHPAPA